LSLAVRQEDFEEAQERWEQILPSCATNTVYVTPLWQRTWWRHFGAGSEQHVLTVQDEDALIGVAPLRLRDGVLGLMGHRDLFDYSDFVVVQGREPEFYGAVWARMLQLDWEAVELASIPAGSPTLDHLPVLAKGQGMAVETKEEDKTPCTRLPSSWEEFVAGLGKKRRHELRRKMRRVQAAGDWVQCSLAKPQEVADRMPDFFRLMRASAPDKDAFLTPERERFFAEAAVELAGREQLRLSFLNLDGRPVASNLCMVYGDAYLLYNSGYDPRYSQHAVGLVNKALTIREAIEERKSRFEFLRGTERYKYDLGGEDTSVYALVVRR